MSEIENKILNEINDKLDFLLAVTGAITGYMDCKDEKFTILINEMINKSNNGKSLAAWIGNRE